MEPIPQRRLQFCLLFLLALWLISLLLPLLLSLSHTRPTSEVLQSQHFIPIKCATLSSLVFFLLYIFLSKNSHFRDDVELIKLINMLNLRSNTHSNIPYSTDILCCISFGAAIRAWSIYVQTRCNCGKFRKFFFIAGIA